MISLNDVSLQLGNKPLLEKASITIFENKKVGLIGSNGSGKSSLFKLLLGEYHADAGQINLPQQLRIGHLSQQVLPLDQSALNYTLDGDATLRELEAALKTAEKKENYEQLGLLHGKMADIDGYSAPARASKLLYGLGFDELAQQKSVKDFSGGWRTRLNLAQTLMCPADILLLDEPTNHLDLDAILWLEKWLQRFPGTLIVISHDRVFLDNCVNQIIHLKNHQLKNYTGNYSAFEKMRAEQLALQQKTHEKQQREIAHIMTYVNRFRAKPSKAKQAQSRLKSIERIELVAAAQVDSLFHFEFPEGPPPPNPLISLTNVEIGYPNRPAILKNVNLQIMPGMRVGLLGPNGAGKSTLIKLIGVELKASQGIFYQADGVKLGYYAQHQIEQLTFGQTPIWHLQKLDPLATTRQLRQFLGGFGFSGDMALSSIENFSGGEKARLALALLVWQAPNLLLLDEPTNHLDLEMRNALSMALQSYPGALILVSHDRYLLQNTTDEFLLVADHHVKTFDGDLNDYQKWLLSRTDKKSETTSPASYNKESQKLEKQIEELSLKMNQLDDKLADADLYQPENKEKLDQLLEKKKNLSAKIKETEDIWLSKNQ